MSSLRALPNGHPVLGQNVFVDASAVVSGQVILGDDVSIWPCVSIRGDLLPIHIGARSNIQDGSILHTTQQSAHAPNGFSLSIGEDVTVGHGVILHGCTIGHLCLIGMGSIVLDGVIVQDEVFLGAGSLVPPGKILESGFLWLGNPVKKIRPLTAEERAFLKISAQNYVQLKAAHL
jgi:carbonic anhydrase/acetyltransferase-like protein (isoleucine patch superfamily)